MVSTIVIQYLCVELGGQSLRTVPLTLNEHLICIGISSLPIIAGFFFKILVPARIFEPLVKASKVHFKSEWLSMDVVFANETYLEDNSLILLYYRLIYFN